MLYFSIKVDAYVDPSVMTYTIQAVAGVAIAIGAFVSIYWRKFSRYLQNKYHISFSKKDLEDDRFYLYDETIDKEKIVPNINAVKFKVIEKEATKELSFISRMASGILLAFASSFMLMFYAPLELYLNNIDEFFFDLNALLPVLLKMFLLLFVVLLVFLMIANLIHKKLYYLVLWIGIVLFVVFYIHGNLFAGPLPPMDGKTIVWSEYTIYMIISVVIIIAVILLFFFLWKKLSHASFLKMISIISVVTVLILSITTVTLIIKNNGFKHKIQTVSTNKNIQTFSEDKNFIILVMDATDARALSEIWDSHPQYKETFRDFTWYRNMTGGYSFTRPSVPLILCNQWYYGQEDFLEFGTRAFDESPLILRLLDESYSIGYYAADRTTMTTDKRERFNNLISRPLYTNFRNFAVYESFLTWYRYAPWFLKNIVKVDANLLNYIADNSDFDYYFWDNISFYKILNTREIEKSSEKQFKYIHVEGAHTPYQYDAQVNIIDTSEGTYYQNVECAMTIVTTYINQLKDNGIYDNTVLIVMADHGSDYNDEGEISKINPIFFVKGIDEHHEVTINEAPVSYDDLMDSYMRLLDGKQSGVIFDYKEGDSRDRKFYLTDLKLSFFNELTQKGYASDLNSLEGDMEPPK